MVPIRPEAMETLATARADGPCSRADWRTGVYNPLRRAAPLDLLPTSVRAKIARMQGRGVGIINLASLRPPRTHTHNSRPVRFVTPSPGLHVQPPAGLPECASVPSRPAEPPPMQPMSDHRWLQQGRAPPRSRLVARLRRSFWQQSRTSSRAHGRAKRRRVGHD